MLSIISSIAAGIALTLAGVLMVPVTLAASVTDGLDLIVVVVL
jgi:hypothetical protein